MKLLSIPLAMMISVTTLAEDCPTVDLIKPLNKSQKGSVVWEAQKFHWSGNTSAAQGTLSRFDHVSWKEGYILCYYKFANGKDLILNHAGANPFPPEGESWQPVIPKDKLKFFSQQSFICTPKSGDVRECPF